LEDKTSPSAKFVLLTCQWAVSLALCGVVTFGQIPAANSSASSFPHEKPSPIEQGIDLAARRHCDEALPLLNEFTPQVTDKQLKYQALLSTARCGISKKDGKVTVNALMTLRHEYPKDPEVLYLNTKVFLQIAVDSSEQLAAVAPGSYQVLELKAEEFESQKDWEGAAGIYRKILAANPALPNIHLRLGRAEILQPESDANTEDARKQFEQALALDPTSGSAEYWLGVLERRDGHWEKAIPHFSAATKLDPNLVEALLALGMTLNSAQRFSDAVAPLERYTKLAPEDQTGHYELAVAYLRLGRKEDAARERVLVQQLSPEALDAPPSDSSSVSH
jgi:tetratricopeptide (TPR) repeat protein